MVMVYSNTDGVDTYEEGGLVIDTGLFFLRVSNKPCKYKRSQIARVYSQRNDFFCIYWALAHDRDSEASEVHGIKVHNKKDFLQTISQKHWESPKQHV